MRNGYLILVLLLLYSCKTKDVTIERSRTKELDALVKEFDSLFKKTTEEHLVWQRKQSLISANLVLTSFPYSDSIGNRKPFHYKHYVDGKLKEEIYLEGGEINKTTASTETQAQENKDNHKTEKATLNVGLKQEKAIEKSNINKAKKVKVTGFQFGFYAWLFLIVIVLLVLRWVAKKFKLPDKLKQFLNGG